MPKSIKFSDNELGFLRNHYEQELIDAEMYVGEIRKLLSKLGHMKAEAAAPATGEKRRRGRPAGSKNKKSAAKKATPKAEAKAELKAAAEKAAPKKRGPKPKPIKVVVKKASAKPAPKKKAAPKRPVRKPAAPAAPAPFTAPEPEANVSSAI